MVPEVSHVDSLFKNLQDGEIERNRFTQPTGVNLGARQAAVP
jgi:hypothetical protein